jgi:hypothetical protein
MREGYRLKREDVINKGKGGKAQRDVVGGTKI